MQVSKRRFVTLILSCVIISILVTSSVFYVLAPSASNTMYVEEGVYPGGHNTLWKVGSTYYAKNDNGELITSGSNATTVYNAIVALGNFTTILVKAGNLTNTIRLNIDWVGNNTLLIGEGVVEIETSGGGTTVFVWHQDSETRNIFFHSQSQYYYSHTHTDQMGDYRFYDDFLSNGGNILTNPRPLYIFDGDISTEEGTDGRGVYSPFFSSTDSTYAFETLDDGAFRIYNLATGYPTIKWKAEVFPNGENTTTFNHGLDASPQDGAIFLQGQHYEVCNLIPTAWTATNITVTNYLQDGTLRNVSANRTFWWLAMTADGT